MSEIMMFTCVLALEVMLYHMCFSVGNYVISHILEVMLEIISYHIISYHITCVLMLGVISYHICPSVRSYAISHKLEIISYITCDILEVMSHILEIISYFRNYVILICIRNYNIYHIIY